MRIAAALAATAAAAGLAMAGPAAAAPSYVLSGEVPGLGFGFVDVNSVLRDGGVMRMTTLVVLVKPVNGIDHLLIDMTADCSAKSRSMTRFVLFNADNTRIGEQTPDATPKPFAMQDPVDRTLYGLVCEGAKPFTSPYDSEAEAVASVRR